MIEWTDVVLGEEIDLAYGKSLPAHARRAGPVEVFGSNGCVGHHAEPLVRGPGIIVGRKGSVGEVVYSAGDFWPIDTTYYVVNKGGHDWRFIYHLLSSLGLNRLNSHSAVPGLNREDVYSIVVKLPPKAEQEQIALLLDTVQCGLALEIEAIQRSQDLKLAAMRELFTRGVRGGAQKETEIGPVPESWQLTPCEEIFRLASGKTRPSDLSETPDNDKPFPVLGGNGVMGYSGKHLLDAPRTLIIGRVGEYCGAVHTASGKVWITDNALYAKEWHNTGADLGFVAAFLEYFDLNRFKRMAGQPLVTQGMINEHKIPLPRTLDEQLEVTAVFDAIDRKIDLHNRKRAVLVELFKALLHKSMIGEIRVGDLDLSAHDPTLVVEAAQ
jgi:type I restriction enzyme S subunit